MMFERVINTPPKGADLPVYRFIITRCFHGWPMLSFFEGRSNKFQDRLKKKIKNLGLF